VPCLVLLGFRRRALTRPISRADLRALPRSALEQHHMTEKERWRREQAQRIREAKLQMAQLAGACTSVPAPCVAGTRGALLRSCGPPAVTPPQWTCHPHRCLPGGHLGMAPALPPPTLLHAPPPHTHTHTDAHLEDTTKRTILENEAMAAELDYQRWEAAGCPLCCPPPRACLRHHAPVVPRGS
jgi:hypothetical protein